MEMKKMSKEVVLYRFKTGYTTQYANWIAKALKCDILENHKLKVQDVEQYDTIIIFKLIMMTTKTGRKKTKRFTWNLKHLVNFINKNVTVG